MSVDTFRREVRTILFLLRGSRWATLAPIVDVIDEYVHLENAAHTPTQSRRVSLQIFHACRAIDTFLAEVAKHEAGRTGRPIPTNLTLGGSLRDIQRLSVQGRTFSTPTVGDIRNLTRQRNTYMHKAKCFPSDGDIRRFLTRTVHALNEAITFPT